jgi:hypothetical protein
MCSMQAINGTVCPAVRKARRDSMTTSAPGCYRKSQLALVPGVRGSQDSAVHPSRSCDEKNTSIRCLAGQAELRRTWP